MYVQLHCPPLPHLVAGGVSIFRQGDLHEKRVLAETFDLIVVQSGTLFIEVLGDRHALEPGSFLVIPPQQVHRGVRYCEQETRFAWVHFQADGGHRLTEHPEPPRPRRLNKGKYYRKDPFTVTLPVTGQLPARVQAQLRDLLATVTQVRVDNYTRAKEFLLVDTPEIAGQSAFLQVLSLLSGLSTVTSTTTRAVAEDVYDHLADHLDQPVSLADLSERFAFSEGHLIRVVKQRYGLSPLQLHLHLRLAQACEQLLDTDDPIARIGARVGFNRPSYFGRQFRAFTGQSPSEYRAAARTGRESTTGQPVPNLTS